MENRDFNDSYHLDFERALLSVVVGYSSALLQLLRITKDRQESGQKIYNGPIIFQIDQINQTQRLENRCHLIDFIAKREFKSFGARKNSIADFIIGLICQGVPVDAFLSLAFLLFKLHDYHDKKLLETISVGIIHSFFILSDQKEKVSNPIISNIKLIQSQLQRLTRLFFEDKSNREYFFKILIRELIKNEYNEENFADICHGLFLEYYCDNISDNSIARSSLFEDERAEIILRIEKNFKA